MPNLNQTQRHRWVINEWNEPAPYDETQVPVSCVVCCYLGSPRPPGCSSMWPGTKLIALIIPMAAAKADSTRTQRRSVRNRIKEIELSSVPDRLH